MTDSDKRQLKIKTGSVNRLKKELHLYAKERQKEQQRVERLKEGGADSHDIKHAASCPFGCCGSARPSTPSPQASWPRSPSNCFPATLSPSEQRQLRCRKTFLQKPA